MYELRKDDSGKEWLWPARDPLPVQQRLNTTWHLEKALKYVKKRDVVVQAGGNCGQWPLWLAPRFKHVVTFEPSPENFVALTYNTRECLNVYRFQAALFDALGLCNIEYDAENCEGDFLGFDDSEINAPLMMLDTLIGDADVDLISLDVEGTEVFALQGARAVLERSKPVLLLEDRHSERYKYTMEELVKGLERLGYKVVDRASHDLILVAG